MLRGKGMAMDDKNEFYVTLFSALVSELGKSQKRWLVMQLAEILARRVTASAELSRNRTAHEAAETAAQLIRNMASGGAMLSSRRRVGSVLLLTTKRTPKPASLLAPHETVEAAKKAIRLKFESWRAVKTGG